MTLSKSAASQSAEQPSLVASAGLEPHDVNNYANTWGRLVRATYVGQTEGLPCMHNMAVLGVMLALPGCTVGSRACCK